MSARVAVPEDALAAIDGERRAKRAIRCIEHGMALTPDSLLHEALDALAVDGEHPKVTPRLRAFMRAVSKRLEGAK